MISSGLSEGGWDTLAETTDLMLGTISFRVYVGFKGANTMYLFDDATYPTPVIPELNSVESASEKSTLPPTLQDAPDDLDSDSDTELIEDLDSDGDPIEGESLGEEDSESEEEDPDPAPRRRLVKSQSQVAAKVGVGSRLLPKGLAAVAAPLPVEIRKSVPSLQRHARLAPFLPKSAKSSKSK